MALRHSPRQRTGTYDAARGLEFGNNVFADEFDRAHDLFVRSIQAHDHLIRANLLVASNPFDEHIRVADKNLGFVAEPVEVSGAVADFF